MKDSQEQLECVHLCTRVTANEYMKVFCNRESSGWSDYIVSAFLNAFPLSNASIQGLEIILTLVLHVE